MHKKWKKHNNYKATTTKKADNPKTMKQINVQICKYRNTQLWNE